MRLLMTADAVGGVWTYALGLARGLRPHGIATTLALLGPAPNATQREAADTVPDLALIETGQELDWLARDAATVGEAAAAVADIARAAADVVQLNSPALAALASFDAPVVGVAHSCLATWWDAVIGGTLPADFRWRTELLAQGYAACDALVAPSAAFAIATARRYGRRPRVVHNGLDAGPAAALPRLVPERFVLTAGRLWDEGKNVAMLDTAAALLAAPVLAAGPLRGPDGARAELRHVEPLGALSQSALVGWMRRAPVFASVARYEPFGLAVLEAAQSGCALVLSDIPTFRELWQGAALFVPPDDPPAIAAALRRVLDDAPLATRLAQAASWRARSYGLAAMAAAMRDVYRTARLLPSHEVAA